MASSHSDPDSSSMFMQRGDGKREKSPNKTESTSRKNSVVKANIPAEIITVKDFFDFMKTAYQVYEHLEGDEDEGTKINWEELTKLTVINHVIEQQERDLLCQTAFTEQKPITSKSDTALEKKNNESDATIKRFSCSEIEGKNRRRPLPSEARVEMLGVWTEANLNCKLNDVINEGILDSILPYLVGYKKPSKTTSVYTPTLKKSSSVASTDVKKPASFGGFINEKESRDRLGRRKSSVVAAQDRSNQKQDGDVEIHVCDEVKGLKKDFRCPQKLLVTKMGYFADVTAGQKLEDMDISVHCDIQIFDWLMRWVKRDTILVADWPLLDPHNVVPILVSASFLQMEPLLHDCLIYCHAHMNEIVKTSTNLACLSDALLTRLAAMYTNAELEAIRDRKDKIQSRLYCKMILSLAEPVPETLRGHYATLATLFKCNKCNKLLGRQIAEQVPCQPASMRIDRRGNVVSSHTKDPTWSLNEYITWLYGELRSWRRVYWRLWADCHFLHCQLCENYFPAYQMEWCSHHEQQAHMFAVDDRPPLPAGRYPCCGERAYRFETISRNTRDIKNVRFQIFTHPHLHPHPHKSMWSFMQMRICSRTQQERKTKKGCQFREHVPDEQLPADAAAMELYTRFRDIIAMRPPHLVFPERLTRLVAREPGEEAGGRLQCKEVFWWEGIVLVPPRQPLGLLGKLYTSNNKFNPNARPGSPALAAARCSAQSLAGNNSTVTCSSPPPKPELKLAKHTAAKEESPRNKELHVAPTAADTFCCKNSANQITPKNVNMPGAAGGGNGGAGEAADESSDSDESEQSSDSGRSDEDAPRRLRPRAHAPAPPAERNPGRRSVSRACGRVCGRVWVASLSARSNQDGQRRFEERAATHMRAALARRLQHAPRNNHHPGGVYAKLEAEWRERHAPRQRNAPSARTRPAPRYK